jgi:hypothetical protein
MVFTAAEALPGQIKQVEQSGGVVSTGIRRLAMSTTNKIGAAGMAAGGGVLALIGFAQMKHGSGTLGLFLAAVGVAGIVGGGYQLVSGRGVL